MKLHSQRNLECNWCSFLRPVIVRLLYILVELGEEVNMAQSYQYVVNLYQTYIITN